MADLNLPATADSLMVRASSIRMCSHDIPFKGRSTLSVSHAALNTYVLAKPLPSALYYFDQAILRAGCHSELQTATKSKDQAVFE